MIARIEAGEARDEVLSGAVATCIELRTKDSRMRGPYLAELELLRRFWSLDGEG